YNEIDGIPSHANKWLLHDVLRGEWGFKGAVVSDYFAIRELVTRHRMFKDVKDAGARAIDAGVDVETPDGEGFNFLVQLVREGKVSQG
ncbi:beta-glucosidase, partial [Escherichia coli]|nr:beta-glucosidase [Escherichia coli]